MLDLVIRGGTVVDGTGTPGVQADVGVVGDTIAYVGSDLPPADHVLDAAGYVVSPGFVDIHSHSDYTLLLNRNAESSIRQGVTTVLGNCGASCAPLPNPKYLPFLAPEYIPGVDVRWQTFGQWLDVMEQGGCRSTSPRWWAMVRCEQPSWGRTAVRHPPVRFTA